ncbi:MULTISPECIES: hypothetical protein [unclassified Rhizobium]|jgi:hypothetical protein|uniref:hypothetical protein n=1 Tax=unclassified Rhizobium TaxID=2613769 RepID=UPI000B33EFC4|nr:MULTISPECIES: hypothetical protein [unclassified Rhizobium]MBN8953713.1 hypothetical protein [Rhizobium tropici]RKD56138.1 hypothetical protein BJ928_11167 [Rhizobium sp. WW_1]
MTTGYPVRLPACSDILAIDGSIATMRTMTVLSQDTNPPPIRFLFRLPSLTLQLLWRFWPQLMALWLLGLIGNSLLNELAVMIGRLNAFAGLSTLALVVLLKLVIIVALFETVRPGLPSLDAASRAAAARPEIDATAGSVAPSFTSILALTLVPFFAYYAAWGFLGDTVRDYSRLSLDLMLFGEDYNPLKFGSSAWLLVSVAVAWVVRRFAKFMHTRSKAPIWAVIIVVCEANWAFIGLFVISTWQGDIRSWIAKLPETVGHFFGFLNPVGNAAAATLFPPTAEDASLSLSRQMRGLFLYALYPVVWLTLAALVYGYDINGERPLTEGRLARAVSRWQSLPKAIRDFVSHFIAGTAKRYRALAEGVGLTLGSGLGLLLAVILLYRLLDWGAAWAWYGTSRLIGVHDLPLWHMLAQAISLFLGSPSAPGDGVLVMPIKICLLAAALEIGFAQGRQWRRGVD